MSNLVLREDIINEKLRNIPRGKRILEFFKIAEEFGMGNEIELQNAFSFAAMEFVSLALAERYRVDVEKFYHAITNVYYVVELYIEKQESGYEDIITALNSGRINMYIKEANDAFNTKINHLKKVISKSKKKLVQDVVAFKDIKNLLREFDSDLSICSKYPALTVDLSDFDFGRFYGVYKPELIDTLTGFEEGEKAIYALYDELAILSKFDSKSINNICSTFFKYVGAKIPFSIFEKVINNYLFASVYSENPEDLKISKVDAELLIREIKMGTLSADELINQLIDKFGFEGHRANYLVKYGKYLQKRIDMYRNSNAFMELFLMT